MSTPAEWEPRSQAGRLPLPKLPMSPMRKVPPTTGVEEFFRLGNSPSAPGLRRPRLREPRPSLAPPGHLSQVTETVPLAKQPNRGRDRKRKERCCSASQMGGRTQPPSQQPTMRHSERPGRHENRPHPGHPGPWFSSAQARAACRAWAVLLRARQPRSPAPATPLPLSLWPITK